MLFDKLIAKRVAAAESEILKKHYAEVENMYNKMCGWRHDYRSHIQTMKVHAKNGEYEEIDRYLDMLDDDLTHVDMVVLKAGSYYAFVDGKMVRLDESTTKATFFGDDEQLYLPFEFAKSVGLAKDSDKTYNHYGVVYVDITAALESCGKTVTRSDDILVLADKALTEDELLILYRALY